MTTPRIYVACLAAYNAGTLHGRWIDAAQSDEDIYAEVRAMLAASPEPGAEEWAIHDFEGFGPLRLSEYESFARVAEIAQGIEEHGEAFAAYLNSVNPDGAVEDFEESYRGTWDSEKAHAEEFVSDCGWGGLEQVPDALLPYLDFDMIASDLGQDLYAVTLSNYDVAIFWAS